MPCPLCPENRAPVAARSGPVTPLFRNGHCFYSGFAGFRAGLRDLATYSQSLKLCKVTPDRVAVGARSGIAAGSGPFAGQMNSAEIWSLVMTAIWALVKALV